MALLPLLLLLLLRIVASAPASPPATALFVLGDSTASCAATTLPLNLSLTSSSGNCLFPSAHRLLPDLLAAKMGLPPPPLISTLNGTAAEVAWGVNFAGEDGGRGAIFRLGAVGQQLRLATETLQLLRLEAPTPQDADAAAGRRPTRRRPSTQVITLLLLAEAGRCSYSP
uniref:Xylanase inhibitor C-terminal domain-containing protein n=1 Tax=Oryza glumipatula TaxID=40148 RepID=A0A0E0BNB2_9ORYZ